ncbi:MAG TPA: hypothetical protein VK821_01215, partial [Dehalococcoidia bacterium]|nr:hypothetical protein [Dehalococcoidia bacterium]
MHASGAAGWCRFRLDGSAFGAHGRSDATRAAFACTGAPVTQVQDILDYLWSIAPNAATNTQIAYGTGISSHQAVYMATQDLLRQSRVRSAR